MSIGFLMDDQKSAIVWRGPMLHSALKQFLNDVNWGGLDYLVLDLPPGTGDVSLTLAQQVKVTGAVIVTTPQEVALMDVYKSVSMCEKLSIPVLGVIENMSFFMDSAGVRHELFGVGGGQKIADHAKTELIGQVPLEPPVREWGNKGTPNSAIASAISGGEGLRANRRQTCEPHRARRIQAQRRQQGSRNKRTDTIENCALKFAGCAPNKTPQLE